MEKSECMRTEDSLSGQPNLGMFRVIFYCPSSFNSFNFGFSKKLSLSALQHGNFRTHYQDCNLTGLKTHDALLQHKKILRKTGSKVPPLPLGFPEISFLPGILSKEMHMSSNKYQIQCNCYL